MALIKGYIAKKGLDEAISMLKRVLKKNKIQIVVKKADLENALDVHLRYVENLTRQISFKEMLKSKLLKGLYINLDIQLSPKRLLPQGPVRSSYKIEALIPLENHLVVLGDPGAGKTTTIKSLSQKLLHEEDPFLKNYNFPLLIQLRDLNQGETLFSRIAHILGVSIFFEVAGELKVLANESIDKYKISLICDYIDALKPIVLIDGLDEINEDTQVLVTREIRTLCNYLTSAKVLLTCRSGAFDVHLDNTDVFEIRSLNESQIATFITNWFRDKKLEADFVKEMTKSTFRDFAIRPLTLSHLCALYEKYRRLPEKPKYIYKKLIALLLEEWDAQREIIRETQYYNFENERKFEFLANLAFQLTLDFDKKRFSEEELLSSLMRFHTAFNIKQSELIRVINEIESHNGIFVKSSYETYEFSHKSMQEYLAADHIVRKGSIPFELLSRKDLSNELAIAVGLSATPNNDYFYRLIYGFFLKDATSVRYFNQFFHRLSLEKPDFANESFLAFTIYLLYNRFYLDTDSKGKTSTAEMIYKSRVRDSYFEQIFTNILKAPNVAGSFRTLNKAIKLNKLSSGYLYFETGKVLSELPDITEVRAFTYPDYITVNQKYVLKHI